MGEKVLRFVVNEVNKMLDKDYNMISFDSLSKNALNQIVADCLNKLEAMPKVDVEKNTDDSFAKLLEAINNIKVPTTAGTNINEFTEGIVQGKRNIVHPILHWILSNQTEVKKRAYFSKYLKKASLPMTIAKDPDIQPLLMQYDHIIQEFKHVHSENTKYSKMGKETQEYRKEIEKLTNNLSKISKQIERQRAKFENIPNKESLLVSVKAFRSEIQQEKTLDKQLQEQTVIVNQLDTQIKTANERLKHQKGLRLASGGPLGQLQSEVQTISMIVRDRLPQEFDAIKNQLELVESISTGPPPTSNEISVFQSKVDQTSLEVQKMLEQTLLKNDPRDDKLAQFRQHATVIANNKQLAADGLIEIKEELNTVRQQVADKEAEMQRIIGGTMPQGEELKRFVSKLRARSVIYKEQRAQLLELQAEVGVLNRTQEKLMQQDSTLAEALQNRNTHEQPVQENAAPDNMAELTKACKDLVLQINSNKAESALIQQELKNLKRDCEELSTKHQQAKEVYDSSTSNLSHEIKKLEQEVTELEKSLADQEDEWKALRRELDKKEDMMSKLKADDYYYEDGKMAHREMLTNNLKAQEALKEDLEAELKEIIADKEEREQQVIMWHSTLELLKCKENGAKKSSV